MPNRPAACRQRGESPKAYAKRMREDAIDAELAENERKEREKRDKQEKCTHYDCTPTRWDWETGKVREMYCNDCWATKYFEDSDNEKND